MNRNIELQPGVHIPGAGMTKFPKNMKLSTARRMATVVKNTRNVGHLAAAMAKRKTHRASSLERKLTRRRSLSRNKNKNNNKNTSKK